MNDNSVDQFAASREAWLGNVAFDPKDDIGGVEDLHCGKVWVTSDTHFGHKNILVYEAASRPFKDYLEMNQALVERWNAKVGDNDVVLHLGDFAPFRKPFQILEITKQLKGRKFLMLGNHDREQHFHWTSLGFERVIELPSLFDGKFILSHEPLKDIPDGKVNIFGHVHGSKWFKTVTPNAICACVERWDCAPLDFDDIRNMFASV